MYKVVLNAVPRQFNKLYICLRFNFNGTEDSSHSSLYFYRPQKARGDRGALETGPLRTPGSGVCASVFCGVTDGSRFCSF